MADQDGHLFWSVFENSPVGLVLVNRDTTLREVNKYMCKAFNLTENEITGKRFGNIFNCAKLSASDELCGQTAECENCGLNGGMRAVLNEGVTIPDTVMDHPFVISGTEQKKWFVISASRIELDNDIFAIVSFSDITIQKEYEALLNSQLSLDMTKDITNKYTLLTTLKKLAIGKERLAMALIDFDDFKTINDTYGYMAGDKVLEIFCACASQNTRKQDILGRFGGEEFMLIFPGSSAGLMIHALNRVACLLKEKCESELGLRPTFSVGLAEYSRDMLSDLDVNTIIAEIDADLYQAKKRGKNMIVIGGISVPFRCLNYTK